MLGAYAPLHGIYQGIKHAVAGTRTNHKIIRDCADLADIQQQNILTLFLFQDVDNGMSNF